MAIVQNFWLKGASKRLAGAVIYNAMGQTRARQLATSVSNPRTESQMNQRVKWANLVNFYRANSSWMKYAYENKKSNQSEYNKFMSLNVTNSRIFLTKQEAAAGACVVDAYTMTQGSLPSISYGLNGDRIVTNIFLPESFVFQPSVTVKDFAQAVIDTNPAIRAGDQLSIIRFTQMSNDTTSVPYVIVRKYELLMDTTSNDLISNFWPTDILPELMGVQDYPLEFNTTGNSGGFLMILSRTTGGKTFVSSQSILPIDNAATIQAYSSNAQYQAAINSYGTSEDVFLSSDTANRAQNQPIALTILQVIINGISYQPGGYVGTLDSVNSRPLRIVFNDTFTEEVTNVWIDTTQTTSGTAQQSGAAIAGNAVSIASITRGSVGSDAIIRAIRVETATQTYRVNFATTDPGME